MKTLAALVISVITLLSAPMGPQLLEPRPHVAGEISFKDVQAVTDADGNTYRVFKVSIFVRNNPIKNCTPAYAVLATVMRNNGPGGTFEVCPPVIDRTKLDVSESVSADSPPQFDDRNPEQLTFRLRVHYFFAPYDPGAYNPGPEPDSDEFTVTKIFPSLRHPPSIKKVALKVGLPDLIVESLDFKDIVPKIVNGKATVTFSVEAKVKNLGSGPAPACELEFRAGPSPQSANAFQKKPVPPLAAGATAVVKSNQVTYQAGQPAAYILACVDPGGKVNEKNEQNNVSQPKQIPITK